jgi:hypothetical protein
MPKHYGFENAATKIAHKQKIPYRHAAAILAAATRKAVTNGAAKANPNLRRVK